ncbi:vacuolar amino acid transporter 3 [Histoplasma capsulatum G186AR]|uniref:Vacuolar amino acid transporter 3 n=2 Tax=Ajellomyces capsulatus TaxID=5037 RepID=C0NAG8_AJECG|nr:vacuolar amino acid transporter 3 [Histoplasma capsulatum G186AR]EEH10659.1 vacuolar amino acid transporter 3 [Histoplasma capsulatum G186AR]KAG5288546.1 vacuolar amino acid transporter 3 [Histoplasma capsulatum]QSS71121.1 vacuolar amino acid transporter 3 [Histoplasma capsulatum G186AR]
MSDNPDKSPLLSHSQRPGSPIPSIRSGSPAPGSLPRHITTARLATPIPSSFDGQSQSQSQSPRAIPISNGLSLEQITLPPRAHAFSLHGPGHSALASALQHDSVQGKPSGNTSPPSTKSDSPPLPPAKSTYGSFDARSGKDGGSDQGAGTMENPDIVRKHLVQPQHDSDNRASGQSSDSSRNAGPNEEFSSLQLQGGDITRPIYRWAEELAGKGTNGSRRRRSFDIARPEPESEVLDINTIKVPGGFRRDFLRRVAGPGDLQDLHAAEQGEHQNGRPVLLTNNFLEFLTLYGHFAGEELEEDDEALGPDEYFAPDLWSHRESMRDEDRRLLAEEEPLLRPETPGKPRRPKERTKQPNTTSTGAMLLLLKSFVGTGVLFLPRAFMNGGMLFSSVVLVSVSLLSYYCFILLVNTRLKIHGSFGDIGGVLYGKHMRRIILGSIVLSQLGFVSAYIVFVSQNLQAFVLAVSKCKTYIDIKLMILIQLVVFLPLSLIRDISKLGFTALIADVFILMGIIYLYVYGVETIVDNGGVADIKPFNPVSWTLFIGTAIFTYEGVGLIIPIQESMKKPQKFPGVLAFVMFMITAVFLSMGVLGYAAFGSKTETVVLLNLPQDSKVVNGIQFLYSLAILLSTPLQLFPAIRILENELFTRSGKYNPGIKWKKNGFRSLLVVFCALVAWGGAADLDKFVALVGSFACVPLVYVYPPMLHLKAVSTTARQRYADIGLAVFGMIGCVYTTVLTVSNWAAGESSGNPRHCSI